MDYFESLQRTVDYIEEHLKEEFDIRSAIKQSGYSATHFYRIFQAFTGQSVMDYIRNRRLSACSVELCITSRRLLDIAFDHGFHPKRCLPGHFIVFTKPLRVSTELARIKLFFTKRPISIS